MKSTLFLAVALLLPLVGYSQLEQPDPLAPKAPEKILVPWTSGITAGFSIWPFAKERLRLGYTWETTPNKHWVHELAYVNAISSIWDVDQEDVLQGALLRTEYRIYDPGRKGIYFYHSFALSYMYTQYQYSQVVGMECNEWGECAYFKNVDEPLPTHTTTLTANAGWLFRLSQTFHVSLYGGLGIQGSYFPKWKTDLYFGRGPVFMENEQFVLQPRFRLGANMLFSLKQRKQAGE